MDNGQRTSLFVDGSGRVKTGSRCPFSRLAVRPLVFLVCFHVLLGLLLGPLSSLLALLEACIVYFGARQQKSLTKDVETKAALTMLQDKNKELRQEIEELQGELQEVSDARACILQGSPAYLVVDALDSILAGEVPERSELLLLRSSILASCASGMDVFQQTGLGQNMPLEPDVEQALMRSLFGLPATSPASQYPLDTLHEITPGLVPYTALDKPPAKGATGPCLSLSKASSFHDELNPARKSPPSMSGILAALVANDSSTLDPPLLGLDSVSQSSLYFRLLQRQQNRRYSGSSSSSSLLMSEQYLLGKRQLRPARSSTSLTHLNMLNMIPEANRTPPLPNEERVGLLGLRRARAQASSPSSGHTNKSDEAQSSGLALSSDKLFAVSAPLPPSALGSTMAYASGSRLHGASMPSMQALQGLEQRDVAAAAAAVPLTADRVRAGLAVLDCLDNGALVLQRRPRSKSEGMRLAEVPLGGGVHGAAEGPEGTHAAALGATHTNTNTDYYRMRGHHNQAAPLHGKPASLDASRAHLEGNAAEGEAVQDLDLDLGFPRSTAPASLRLKGQQAPGGAQQGPKSMRMLPSCSSMPHMTASGAATTSAAPWGHPQPGRLQPASARDVAAQGPHAHEMQLLGYTRSVASEPAEANTHEDATMPMPTVKRKLARRSSLVSGLSQARTFLKGLFDARDRPSQHKRNKGGRGRSSLGAKKRAAAQAPHPTHSQAAPSGSSPPSPVPDGEGTLDAAAAAGSTAPAHDAAGMEASGEQARVLHPPQPWQPLAAVSVAAAPAVGACEAACRPGQAIPQAAAGLAMHECRDAERNSSSGTVRSSRRVARCSSDMAHGSSDAAPTSGRMQARSSSMPGSVGVAVGSATATVAAAMAAAGRSGRVLSCPTTGLRSHKQRPLHFSTDLLQTQKVFFANKAPPPSPQRPPVIQVEAVLDAAYTSLSCDCFELDAVTQGHPLSTLAFYLLHKTGLTTTLGLNAIKTARFLRRIEAGYSHDNPYHNATHVADVLQTLHAIMRSGNFMLGHANPHLHLAAYLAAVLHDYEHGGLTNDFLINTSSELAINYNDRAPLENHHLAAGFRILLNPDFNFLSHMPKRDYLCVRKTIIDLVLATDMKQHFALLGQFNTLLQHARFRSSSVTSTRLRPGPNLTSHGPLAQRTSLDMLVACRSFNSGSKSSRMCAIAAATAAAAAQPHAPLQGPLSQILSSGEDHGRLSRAGGTHQLFPRMLRSATATLAADAAALQQQMQQHQELRVASVSMPLQFSDRPPHSCWHARLDSPAHSARRGAGTESTQQEPLLRHLGSMESTGSMASRISRHSHGSSSDPTQASSWLDIASLDAAQRVLLLQIALKAADLGHLAEDEAVHVRWVHCLQEEFYLQGDKEKALGLPVSPLFDRHKPGIVKSQIGFFDVVAVPLFQALARAVPGTQPLMDGVSRNFRHWKMEQQRQAERDGTHK